ncbi:MAG: glycosyltransferase family 1 protein [Verrucomicrobiota bacterium]
MKVLLSAGMIQGGRSGVGRYVIQLARALQELEGAPELFLAGLAEDREHFPEVEDGHWVTIPSRFARGPFNLLWHQVFLAKELRARGIEVVHIPSYRRMLWRCPVPQVATIHDCAPFVMAGKYDVFRNFFGQQVVPRIARRVQRVIAVSETTARDITRYLGVPAERLEVVPNGIDHTAFRPQAAEEVARFRERKKLSQPFFLYVARLEHPAKNHLRLIEAFERFREETSADWQLVLPGAPWHGSERIEAAVQDSPHSAVIRLEGFVENEDLPLWYAAAGALVFPSLMEGFGLPLLEAMACECLVACADATSLPEVAGPASLLFEGTSVESLTQALQELSEMRAEERERRRGEGLAWAAQFTWKRHAEGAKRLYGQVKED